MLGAGDEVQAGVRIERHVLAAGDIGVQERGGPGPVLGRGGRVEQPGSAPAARARSSTSPLAPVTGSRAGVVVNGKKSAVLLVLERLGVARGLGEAVVEAALAGAGDVDQRAVEDHARLVHVQASLQHVLDHAADWEMPKISTASGSGAPGSARGLAVPVHRGIEPEERDRGSGEPETDDARILRQ